MTASWEEMQDAGYMVFQPTTGRILPTLQGQGLSGVASRLKERLGLGGAGVRSGAFAGYQGAVQTRDPYGAPQPMQAVRSDLEVLSRSIQSPGDRVGLGVLHSNLHHRGLRGINRKRAGRICAATSAIGQITTAVGVAVSSKDAVKGQGSASGWETAQNIAGQTDELCSALFSQSTAPIPPQNVMPPAMAQPPVAPSPPATEGFGSTGNNLLLYAGGAVALVGVLYLLKD